MRAWRVLPAALLLVVSLAGPARATGPTWVGIGGPIDWAPVPGYTLEIGLDAWTINALNGGGVTTVALSEPTIVRVRRLSDCVPVVRFVALPGRDYYIRFAADGTPRVEDWTAEGMDAGPALGDPGAAVCPALPDSATAGPPGGATDVPSLVVPGALGALAAILAMRYRARFTR